ncbi:MAG: succinate dehydrogenase, hydrophobic membrane anchor protein [Methylotenera sp.]
MLIQLLTDKYPGMRLWLSQRLTAVIMAIYVLFFMARLVVQQPAGYEAWHAFVSPGWFRLITFLFFICLFSHAWLGVRDVLRDYIFNPNLRNYLQTIVDVLLVVYLVWVSIILWNI